MIEIILDFKDIKTEYELYRVAYKKLIGIEMPETSERGAVRRKGTGDNNNNKGE